MAIVNRDKDASEQREQMCFPRVLAAVGTSQILWVAPFPFEVVKVAVTARALSGAPTMRLDIGRFGGTASVSMMVALTVPVYGTSGAFVSGSLAAAGSSFIQGAAGDCLVMSIIGANTAADDLALSVVVKKLQDIVSHYNA